MLRRDFWCCVFSLRFNVFIWIGGMRINKRIIPFELQPRKCIRNGKVFLIKRMKEGRMALCAVFIAIKMRDTYRRSEAMYFCRIGRTLANVFVCWKPSHREFHTIHYLAAMWKCQERIRSQGKQREIKINKIIFSSSSPLPSSVLFKSNCFCLFISKIMMTVETCRMKKRPTTK